MSDLFLDHALCARQSSGQVEFLALSNGLPEIWQEQIIKICTAFGEPPADLSYERAIFACPVDKRNALVIQVAERTGIGSTFYLLIMPEKVYRWLGGDPFYLADQFPPLWDVRGEIEPRSCDVEPAPYRTVEEVQTILKESDAPTLLGAAQALLDGGKLVFQRSAPDETIVRQLWQILPTSSRSELWPSSFLFAPGLPLNVVVTPKIDEEQFLEYCREDQLGDYPEGRYELRLQLAVESGDQQDLDWLFARRSSRETIRLGLLILLMAMILPILSGLISQIGKTEPKPVPGKASNPEGEAPKK